MATCAFEPFQAVFSAFSPCALRTARCYVLLGGCRWCNPPLVPWGVSRPAGAIRLTVWLELCSHASAPNPLAASDSFCTATQECLTRISHVANRATGRMHCAHALFSIAAAAGNPTARELFDKLRRTYNLMAPHGSITVPVLDEWRGISAICDKVACG